MERDQEEATERFRELTTLTRLAHEEMRSLLFELYPSALVERELGQLIHQLADNIKTHYHLTVSVRVRGKFMLSPEHKIALYRITQEALNNIIKHSKARHVKISLSCGLHRTTLRISDDGRGFDVSSLSSGGMGMRNMRERTEEIGATFDIGSTIGVGTEITVRCNH